MRLDLSAPDYTTLSRRSQHLRRRLRPVPPGEGLHLVLDSTGLSIVGAGEWATAKHGGRGRRGWRKLHRVDQSGVIRVHTLTEATTATMSPSACHLPRRDPCPHATEATGEDATTPRSAHRSRGPSRARHR